MINDSDEIKHQNSLPVLPTNRRLAKAKTIGHANLSVEYFPSFW